MALDRVLLSLDGAAHNTGGVGRYAANLIAGLRRLGVDATLLAGLTTNPYLSRHAIALRTPFGRGIGLPNRLLERAYSILRRPQIHHKLWHSRLGPIAGARTVLTVYDIIPELFPGQFRMAARDLDAKRKWCEQSDVVLAISETTKRDLVHRLGIDSRKIIVTPLGVSPVQTEPDLQPHRRRRLLYIGGRTGYKSFDTALEAIAALPGDAGVTLRAVGAPFEAAEIERIRALGVTSRVSVGAADDSQLLRLYREALAVVSTSHYEGFGLPLLEGMANGCPVICTDIPAFREVGGEIPIYFQSNDGEGLARAIESLLQDPEATMGRRRAGVERARSFSWDRTSEVTVAAYRTALG